MYNGGGKSGAALGGASREGSAPQAVSENAKLKTKIAAALQSHLESAPSGRVLDRIVDIASRFLSPSDAVDGLPVSSAKEPLGLRNSDTFKSVSNFALLPDAGRPPDAPSLGWGT